MLNGTVCEVLSICWPLQLLKDWSKRIEAQFIYEKTKGDCLTGLCAQKRACGGSVSGETPNSLVCQIHALQPQLSPQTCLRSRQQLQTPLWTVSQEERDMGLLSPVPGCTKPKRAFGPIPLCPHSRAPQLAQRPDVPETLYSGSRAHLSKQGPGSLWARQSSQLCL